MKSYIPTRNKEKATKSVAFSLFQALTYFPSIGFECSDCRYAFDNNK